MKEVKPIIDLIKLKSQEIFNDLVRNRRHLHKHPELSFEEYESVKYVRKELESIGIIRIEKVTETGLVAIIEGRNPEKKCIALRADMDALPIDEINDQDYRSINTGVMHACGHDVHTSCLLGAARILYSLKNDFEGSIKLIFQPGEEKYPGGASLMIKEGVLEHPTPSAILGLHVYPDLPAGSVGFCRGQYMASADEIYITINGKGGHAALPHQTIDPIAISAIIITSLQQVISRRNNPLTPTVLTFGKIAGGHATNVIPDQVEIEGTLRTFDEEWREEAKQLIRKVVVDTAEAWGASASVFIPDGYPVLFNQPELHDTAKLLAMDYLGNENVATLGLRMSAEDFSFYTQKIKGCFFRIGTNRENKYFTTPVHNSRFDVEEESMITGAGLMSWLAVTLLEREQ